MPYSIIHLNTSLDKLENKKLDNKDYLDFIVWWLLVDTSYNLYSHWIKNITRANTHYHVGQNYFEADFPQNFYQKEIKNKKLNYIKLGYYYHLLVDKYYRDFEWKKAILNTNLELKYLYEVYRKQNAVDDLIDHINKYWDIIINQLYNYQIDNSKLPSIFKNINTKIIQNAYKDIIDNMTFKKHFIKYEKEVDYYKHIDWKIVINKKILEKYNKHFSRKYYLEMIKKCKNILIDF
jgi:hypothetical protein